ncbi:hypothetical protein CDAR_412011 [Caerostris darwini]|uniref:Uncharacterized protein n=1 Tax=Caerostris darwini TaxID=1538125 RepID=A0AAV4WCL8_9ARAC|nr:hypothetical protein CDAR_412011 [Caerostris darwini]
MGCPLSHSLFSVQCDAWYACAGSKTTSGMPPPVSSDDPTASVSSIDQPFTKNCHRTWCLESLRLGHSTKLFCTGFRSEGDMRGHDVCASCTVSPVHPCVCISDPL